MPPAMFRVGVRNVEQVLVRTPWVLVRVDANPVFHAGLAELLDAAFPRSFTFAVLPRGEFRPDQLSACFHTSLGPMRHGVGNGYYLLHGGYVVGNHVGVTRPGNVAYGTDAHEAVDRAELARLAGVRLSPTELDALSHLWAYFAPLIERKQGAPSGFPRDAGPPPPRSTPPPVPPRPPPAPAEDDPHVVLGIARGATAEEIKAAYKNQLKLNHPDKVTHLSPALQKFAEQQVLKIKAAYEALTRSSG